eukprot:103179-Rhodomonas_salina.1
MVNPWLVPRSLEVVLDHMKFSLSVPPARHLVVPESFGLSVYCQLIDPHHPGFLPLEITDHPLLRVPKVHRSTRSCPFSES